MDEKRQIQVVESIARIDTVSPSAIKIVEAEMNKKFSNIMTSSNVKVGGIDYVASVMNNLDRTSEKNRNVNEPVAPTAASAWEPMMRPTMMESARL